MTLLPPDTFGALRAADTWIFDLDNTLYAPGSGLFTQIRRRMNTFIMGALDVDETTAAAVRHRFFLRYGTTLRGLMTEYNVRPHDFLEYVHDVDYGVIPADPGLRAAIAALGGRKYVFTNGSQAHARAVLQRAGLSGLFDGIFDVIDARFMPKPDKAAYRTFIKVFDVVPEGAVFFEDLAKNLEFPHTIGMKTVLVSGENARQPHAVGALPAQAQSHIHYRTSDLSGFLRAATCKMAEPGQEFP